MSTGGLSHPTVLPLSLVSYDGSRADDENDTPIENVLSDDRDLFHCSRDGRNFDLVLQYTPSIATPSASCTLTHVVIHGPPSCTAPVSAGIVFASLDRPDVAAYSAKYDDLTREQYEQLPLSALQADGAVAYFALTDMDRLQMCVTLPSWTECRYLHVKLLAARSAVDDQNIDVERIAAVGFDTAQRPFEEVALPATVPQQLGLMREELGRWNRVSHDHMRAIREQPACILFGSDPMKAETTAARTLLHAIAMSGKYDGALTFYHYDDSSTEKDFAETLAGMAGLPARDDAHDADQQQQSEGAADQPPAHSSAAPASATAQPPKRPAAVIVITATADESDEYLRYHYSGPLDDAALRTWLDSYMAGTLTPFIKSEPRPAGDVDPKHAGVLQVVASSFEELVLDAGETSVLLFVTRYEEDPMMSAMVRCWLHAMADVLTLPQLHIASFDADNNDSPPILPADATPGILLFPALDRHAPSRVRESPTPQSLPRFLHKHLPALVSEADVDALSQSPRLAAAFDYASLLLDCRTLLRQGEAATETLQGALTGEEDDAWQQRTDALLAAWSSLVRHGEGDPALQATARSALEALAAELVTHQPLRDAVEAAKELLGEVVESLRGARSALSDAEFNELTTAIMHVSSALPRGTPNDKAQPAASDSGISEIKQDSESEEQHADGDGEHEASSRRQPKTAPLIMERLQATVTNLKQVFDGVKEKLAARQAELAALADGRVVKCHSAAELEAALAAATAAHQLTVIDFTAVWCGPCKAVAPVFGQLSVQHAGVQFAKVDVDECDDVSAAYGVEAMPTFVFVRDGKELAEYRIQGANVKALTRAIEILSATDAPQTTAAADGDLASGS